MKTIDLQQLVTMIQQHETVDAIYLYGSRAKNTAHANSDWDVAVLFSNFEPDLLERAVRPQMLQAKLEKLLDLDDQVLSIVDLQAVPVPLQWNIIQGNKLYDRMIPTVRRMENAIISAWEKDYER
ncbi:type VII toxin-antitoxin system MntA family adenylyltransferase antitoxin [Pelagibaculum spongiae]|uniref:type VII toxin-antitoxin system MntA family adenylyltransferase antitoxin n=1 Tax=Pelagibaculum spongiae TaxID=2080658 RepID=UPI0019D42C1B|nr:nucleotidyltransferase domain-containing protein [Pelagibaculum spongiae]